MSRRHILRSWMLLLMIMACQALFADESDRLFKVYDASHGLADNGAQTIICTKTGRLVISSIGQINFYNGSTFDHIAPTADDIYELSKYTGHYHLYFDKFHHLWVKDKKQVTCVDLLTERFIPDVQGEFRKMGFNGNVEDLFVDTDGCLLLLTKNKLYNCKSRKSFPVRKDKNLQDVDEFKGKLLLMFYDDSSVDAFDLKSGKKIYSTAAMSPQKAENYNMSSVMEPVENGFYQIRNGETASTLLYIDAVSGQWQIKMEIPYHLNNIAIHDNLLYIASQFGYWTYNTYTEEKIHYKTLMRNDYQMIDTDINDISFDLQGGMWIGTEKRGLLYSKPYVSPFKIYDWKNPKAFEYGAMLYWESQKNQEELPRRVNCIYHDSRGWTWQGTYVGLKCYKSDDDKTPIVITTKEGLNNNVVHSVIEDNDHNIWIGTSNGISVLVMEGDQLKRIVSYDQEDNIPCGTFGNGLAMKLTDGTIIMQSLDYVIEFNPANFHTMGITDIKLYPKLIRLMVNGQNVVPGMEIDGKIILERAITRTKEINLNYNQNSISLVFTGLNYFRPVQTYYRVRIKGYMDKWRVYSLHNANGQIDSKGMLHLPIVGIQPGKYEIELQASMSPDDWSVDPYSWVISINEPWWRMTIVYVTLGILIFGLLVINFWFYNRNTRLRLSRNNIEGGVVRRIKTFSMMCDNMSGEVLSPHTSELSSDYEDSMNMDFSNAMLKVVPYVNIHHSNEITITELAKVAQMDITKFYDMMSANLYKTPRQVALKLRLQSVADMLCDSDRNVDEIADELKFSSANYLIASFYHQYRQTPEDYRASNPR